MITSGYLNPAPTTLQQLRTHHNSSFQDYLNDQPEWEADLCSAWTSIESQPDIVQTLSDPHQTIHIATDGSIKAGSGCYGVVLAGPQSILFTNRGKIKSDTIPVTVRRTETIGVLSALVILRKLHTFFGIPTTFHGLVSLWCDNLGTVKMVKKFETRSLTVSEHGAPDIDVILQIGAEMNKLISYGYLVEIHHIKAHQKTPHHTHPLSWPIHLNKEADWLAKSAHLKKIIPHNNTIRYPASNLTIAHNLDPLHTGLQHKIRDAFNDQPLILYLQERFDWNNMVFDSIWWSIHGLALAKFPPIIRLVIQKFNMDHWACNHREAVRGDESQKWCEICYHQEETTDHIVQCPHCHRQEVRDNLMTELSKYLAKTGTPQAMRTCIIQGLNAWLKGSPVPSLNTLEPNASPTLKLAYSTQTTIGWKHFLRGRISIHWASLINGEPKDNDLEIVVEQNKTKSINPITWGSGLLHILWKHVLNFWKVRNETIENIYKLKGITKPHSTLIRLAMQELQGGAVGYNEQDWMQKNQEDFKTMDMISIKIWIRRIKAAKKQFKEDLAINQRFLQLEIR